MFFFHQYNITAMIRNERKSQVGLAIISAVFCEDQMDSPVLWWFFDKAF